MSYQQSSLFCHHQYSQLPLLPPLLKNNEVICYSLLQWTTFSQTSPPLPTRLGWPHTAWINFIELGKAVFPVISWSSFLWFWFQCVCPLMFFQHTYHFTWVSLTLDLGYFFTAAPAKLSCCSLPWKGIFLHGHPSWPWMWSCSSRVCIVGAIVYPVVLYGCDCWTMKKAEHWIIDAFKLLYWRLLKFLWAVRRSNLKEINPEYSLGGLMLKVKLQYFIHLIWGVNSLENTLMLKKIEG